MCGGPARASARVLCFVECKVVGRQAGQSGGWWSEQQRQSAQRSTTLLAESVEVDSRAAALLHIDDDLRTRNARSHAHYEHAQHPQHRKHELHATASSRMPHVKRCTNTHTPLPHARPPVGLRHLARPCLRRAHTHTHAARTRARTRTACARTHIRTDTQAATFTDNTQAHKCRAMHAAHPHAAASTHAHTHVRTSTHVHTHPRTGKHTHARMHSRAHTREQTRTPLMSMSTTCS